MHIFVDLDGVLANFCQAAVDLYCPTDTDDEVVARGRERAPDQHPFSQLEAGLGVSYDVFWNGITNAGAEFWSEMGVLPFADRLWALLNDAVPDRVSILTSPGAGLAAAESAAGKYQWVYEQLGPDVPYRTIVCPAPLKHHLAKNAYGPNILIDDYDKNVDTWNAAGGRAIQWPSLQFHNRHATSADVDQVMQFVASLVVGGGV